MAGSSRPTGGLVVDRGSIWSRLYHGETRIDFVGRFRLWLTISGVVIAAGMITLFARGLNLGIDFDGGTVWEVEANGVTVDETRDALEPLGLAGAKIQIVSSDDVDRIRVQAEPREDPDEAAEERREVAAAMAGLTGNTVESVSINSVGPTWGEEISRKALIALVVFLAAIMLYISLRFEFKMAVATVAALIHDVLVTIGVYAITGFEVTPATVIAILTILGFSIYDGIVVFDKVDENTRLVSSNRLTYSDMVNLSLNQTFMRSLNTSITSVIPVGSLLVVGSFLLGATTLQEFALALMVGLFSGAYSSIFIASPLLARLKEREPRYRDVRRRMEAREAKTDPAGAVAAAPAVDDDEVDEVDEVDDRVPAAVSSSQPPARPAATTIPPRPRKKTRRR
ncbi:MAG: protein translocase subunit SecF [Acidimicrobiales bacterium]